MSTHVNIPLAGCMSVKRPWDELAAIHFYIYNGLFIFFIYTIAHMDNNTDINAALHKV